MTKHVPLCESCARTEQTMASECIRRWREAKAKSEPYTCDCPLLPCETDPSHAVQAAVGSRA